MKTTTNIEVGNSNAVTAVTIDSDAVIVSLLKKLLIYEYPLTTIELSIAPPEAIPLLKIMNDYILCNKCTGNLKLIELLRERPFQLSSSEDWFTFYKKALLLLS